MLEKIMQRCAMNEMNCDQAVLKLNAGAEVMRGAGCTCMQAACAKAVSQLHHRKERIQTVAPISHIPKLALNRFLICPRRGTHMSRNL
jgi:hypothetical protein